MIMDTQKIESFDPGTTDVDKMFDKDKNDCISSSYHDTSLYEIGPLVPEDEDDSIVFRNNWLAYGQSFGIVAGSGIGKSSIAMQMAYNWAIGRSYMATPKKALKIAIIQAEDSIRDIQEQRYGMRRGLSEIYGWSADDIMAAEKNVTFPPDFIGMNGEAFMNALRDYQSVFKKNVIIINPLQRFFGGDVSSQEDASAFAAKCDSLMKSDSTRCCMGIVMHTPKWRSGGKPQEKMSVDDYGEYMMAGSHEWTDWLRAVFVFQRHEGSESQFEFKAAKRGKRLGWKDEYGFDTTKKYFAHSDGYIFWREIKESELDGNARASAKDVGMNVKIIADALLKRPISTTAISNLVVKENKSMSNKDFKVAIKKLYTDAYQFGISSKTVPSRNGKGRYTTFWGATNLVSQISFSEDCDELFGGVEA